MEATSQEGKGAEFAVYLPAVMQPPTVERQPEPGRGHRGRGTALVMDDEVFLRSVTSTMLQRMGYETVTSKDGAEALKLLSEQPFQLVVLDLTIPGGMGGIETAREIRKRHGDRMTVIAMSGYSEASVMTAPGDCGFDGSIAKPFKMVELAGLLNRIAPPRSR
jgi:CheY-like chemotaxis protein